MKGARIPCEKTATMDIRPTGSAVVWSAKVLAQQEAEQMLSSARERAGAITAEARQEAVAIRERAVEDGRQEGFQRVPPKWPRRCASGPGRRKITCPTCSAWPP